MKYDTVNYKSETFQAIIQLEKAILCIKLEISRINQQKLIHS